MARASPLLLGALGAALLLLLQGVHPQVHTQVEILDDSCDAQLDALWANYTSPPVAPVAGCDRDCLAACYTTLTWAITSEKKQDCPTQDAIIACFHPYRAQWYKFVQDCALFQWGASSGSAEGEAASSSSSSSSSSSAADGAATTTAAEGAAPTTATTEGAAPTTAAADPKLGRRRRTLLQEAEAALGTDQENVYNGCFPSFKDAEDFEAYMDGEWEFYIPSNGWGVALSVVFFTTLVLVGFGLPKQVKAPLVRGKNWCMDKLCCGRRRPVTKLDPPAVPAADALAEPAVDNAAEAVAATAPAS